MTTKQTIRFKDPFWTKKWLKMILKKEQEKYKKCPVIPDLMPEYVAAEGWGYVVLGYILAEESFKALLQVRSKNVPKTHSLSTLFNLFGPNDKKIIREYYDDCRATIGGNGVTFPFQSLDDFLENLDGSKNKSGDHLGSFDWRYFPIEEKRSQKMPLVSVDCLHEIVFGCIQIIEYANNGCLKPSLYTYSRRMRPKHERK